MPSAWVTVLAIARPASREHQRRVRQRLLHAVVEARAAGQPVDAAAKPARHGRGSRRAGGDRQGADHTDEPTHDPRVTNLARARRDSSRQLKRLTSRSRTFPALCVSCGRAEARPGIRRRRRPRPAVARARGRSRRGDPRRPRHAARPRGRRTVLLPARLRLPALDRRVGARRKRPDAAERQRPRRPDPHRKHVRPGRRNARRAHRRAEDRRARRARAAEHRPPRRRRQLCRLPAGGRAAGEARDRRRHRRRPRRRRRPPDPRSVSRASPSSRR